jgi:4-diphosphocytidyl-2-C-methyl-D-erythritol kinase
VPEIPLTQLLKLPIEEWQGSVKNDFEPHILAAYPEIRDIKTKMLDAGAVYASMSGSGSAVFGLFAKRPDIAFADDVFVHIEQI